MRPKDPVAGFTEDITHVLAVAQRDAPGFRRATVLEPLLGRALAAAEKRYPGVAAFYLLQALGEVLSWRDGAPASLQEPLMRLAVTSRSLTRWSGRSIPHDAREAERALRNLSPLPTDLSGQAMGVAGVERALRRLGAEVLEEPAPPRFRNIVPPRLDNDRG